MDDIRNSGLMLTETEARSYFIGDYELRLIVDQFTQWSYFLFLSGAQTFYLRRHEKLFSSIQTGEATDPDSPWNSGNGAGLIVEYTGQWEVAGISEPLSKAMMETPGRREREKLVYEFLSVRLKCRSLRLGDSTGTPERLVSSIFDLKFKPVHHDPNYSPKLQQKQLTSDNLWGPGTLLETLLPREAFALWEQKNPRPSITARYCFQASLTSLILSLAILSTNLFLYN